MIARLKAWFRTAWYRDRLGTMLTVAQQRQDACLKRDHAAQAEIAGMRRIVNAAKIAAKNDAVISTTRHACKVGLDETTACVILQWYYLSQKSR